MSYEGPPRRDRSGPPPPRPPGDFMPPQNPRPRPGPPPTARLRPAQPGPPQPGPPRPGSSQFREPQAPPPTRYPAQPSPAPRRRRRPGRILRALLVILLLLLVGLAVYVDRSLNRTDALDDYSGRVADTPGTNWLIVGSDSRAGLTAEEAAELATGDEAAAGGQRTDTIMLLHIPALGSGNAPALVSLPRDSAVPVPGRGRLKLNAAYAFGGPTLLVQTVETVTGVHVDHYAEIGFDGFAGMVDAIGGVQLCPAEPINDPLAGLDIPAGCQEFDGPQALGYVRTRHSPRGDLDRVVRQQEFLGALIAKVAGPGVLLNPLRIVPLAVRAPQAVTVDNGDHVWHLARLGWAMRSLSGADAVTTTVPIAGFGQVADGSSGVLWDREKASELFDALAQDQPVPAGS
ncbi:MAG: LCP family protein [Pseudonocardiaceae bacterium]